MEPFPLLSGESVEYLDASLGGYHAVSNFRFFASQEAGAYNVSWATGVECPVVVVWEWMDALSALHGHYIVV